MAKQSAIFKNLTRLSKIKALRNKREAWKKKLLNLCDSLSNADVDESHGITSEIVLIMTMLDETRGSSYIKYRNRCGISGRPRAVLRRFGLCRNVIRNYAGFGGLVGVKKAS